MFINLYLLAGKTGAVRTTYVSGGTIYSLKEITEKMVCLQQAFILTNQLRRYFTYFTVRVSKHSK